MSPLLETFGFASARGWRVPSTGAAYELISTTLIATNTASLSFNVTGLNSTYKHLELRITARSNGAAADTSIQLRFNSDSGNNYSEHFLFGNGTTVGSLGNITQPQNQVFDITTGASEATSIFGAGIISILDPFSASKNKTIRNFTGRVGSAKEVSLSSGAWYNTAAVTNIYLGCGLGSFISGSRFSLYGIRG